MSVFNRLFQKKKKEFTAKCALSNEPIENGYGYLLSTADIVSSKKFWDNKMTEPEMMSYSVNHFTKQDPAAVQIRSMVFDKYSQDGGPWLVSDTFIDWFDVDKEQAKSHALKYWEQEGKYTPESSDEADTTLETDTFQEYKKYAIMEAGRDYVAQQTKIAI